MRCKLMEYFHYSPVWEEFSCWILLSEHSFHIGCQFTCHFKACIKIIWSCYTCMIAHKVYIRFIWWNMHALPMQIAHNWVSRFVERFSLKYTTYAWIGRFSCFSTILKGYIFEKEWQISIKCLRDWTFNAIFNGKITFT